ncbi:MAG: oligosaccharide flippase family protein [Bacteriovoracaceae bacterium]|nr:oligosaccharide flippase family protein [Bacteriovoracaceae bacterium]
MMLKAFKSHFLKGTPETNKIIVGASYLLFEKISKLVIGLVIHSLMARYLSPENFGKMGYIINLATAFLPVTLFGLEDVAVQKMVASSQESSSEVVTDILFLRVTAFLFVGVLSAFFLLTFRPEGSFEFILMAWIFCVVYNFIGTFYSLELPFLSKVSNRPIFYSRFIGYMAGTALKILGIIQNFGFKFILATYIVEELIGKITLAAYYFSNFNLKKVHSDWSKYKSYVKPSFWIVTGTFLMILENKIGFFLIEKLSDSKSLGFFTASFMLVDLWTFLPVALMSAILPSLVKLQKSDKNEYKRRLEDVHGLFFLVQFFFIIGVWIVAPYLIQVLYGAPYEGTEYFLRWQSLTVVLTFIQILRMRWFLVEEKIRLWALMNGSQLLITFFLAYYLKLGKDISGIVISSFFSFIVINVIFSLKSNLIKEAFKDQLMSFKYAHRLIRNFT